jgi:Tat protein secretion system quality control protein TatD with DNase activity
MCCFLRLKRKLFLLARSDDQLRYTIIVNLDNLENQIKLANELSLPAVIHCRDATEDMMKILHRITPEKFVVRFFGLDIKS